MRASSRALVRDVQRGVTYKELSKLAQDSAKPVVSQSWDGVEVRETSRSSPSCHPPTLLRMALEYALVQADDIPRAYEIERAGFPEDEAASLDSLRCAVTSLSQPWQASC